MALPVKKKALKRKSVQRAVEVFKKSRERKLLRRMNRNKRLKLVEEARLVSLTDTEGVILRPSIEHIEEVNFSKR